MDKKINQIWGDIKTFLGGSLPEHAINTWFDPIKPVAKQNNELILEVPNQFFYEWVESHYSKHINKATDTLFKNKFSIKFIVSVKNQEIQAEEPIVPTNAKESSLIPQLNKEHTFKSFIEGSNNQFAKNAAQAVAENTGGQSFNPLIIYGGTGLGKTHLIHAIGNKVLETKPNQNIVIATSEKFTLDFVNGLRKNKTI